MELDETLTLEQEIVADLTAEIGEDDPNFNAKALAVKVKNAVREVRQRRNYQATGMSEDDIQADLQNYYSNILNIARYDYNQIGAEGEETNKEGDNARTWVNRNTYFNGVYAFVKVL